MDGDELTYSKRGIREQRRRAEQQLARQQRLLTLKQRHLAVLAKMDEATEELEQVLREMDTLGLDEETSFEQPTEAEQAAQYDRVTETRGLDETASSEQPAEADRVWETLGLDEITSSDQPADVASAEEPKTIGEQSRRILKEQVGVKHSPRDIAVKLYANGWVDVGTDIDVILQRLRHSLRRIAARDPNIHRDESGTTFYYWYAAPAPITQIKGVSHPALQGGER